MTSFEKWSLVLTGIQIVVIIAGFVLAFLQLARMRRDSQNQIVLSGRENALKLIARYQDSAFVSRRVDLRTNKELQANIYEVAYLLNFFEEIAVSIKHNAANEDLLEEYFSTVLRLWMEEEYLLNGLKEARKEDSALFENILALYRKWQENRDMRLRIDEIPELR